MKLALVCPVELQTPCPKVPQSRSRILGIPDNLLPCRTRGLWERIAWSGRGNNIFSNELLQWLPSCIFHNFQTIWTGLSLIFFFLKGKKKATKRWLNKKREGTFWQRVCFFVFSPTWPIPFSWLASCHHKSSGISFTLKHMAYNLLIKKRNRSI